MKALRTSRTGRFRGTFVPAGAGTYRFYVATRADGRYARGASRRVVVRVGRSARGGALPR